MQRDSAEAFDANTITQRFVDAVNRRDADALAELFSEDGQHFTEGGMPRGKEALRVFYQADFDSTWGPFSASVTEAVLSGNTAYAVGTFTQGGEFAARGNWITIYKNEGGEWKIHRVMSMNQPAPSGTGDSGES